MDSRDIPTQHPKRNENYSTAFEKVGRLPPSAREIYLILAAEEKGLTTKKLLIRVPYTSRTIRYALKKLCTMELIQKIPYLLDMRQFKYLISKSEAISSITEMRASSKIECCSRGTLIF